MTQEAPSVPPRLTAKPAGPLLEIERQLLSRQGDFERCFRNQWLCAQTPFHISADLRNARLVKAAQQV